MVFFLITLSGKLTLGACIRCSVKIVLLQVPGVVLKETSTSAEAAKYSVKIKIDIYVYLCVYLFLDIALSACL